MWQSTLADRPRLQSDIISLGQELFVGGGHN